MATERIPRNGRTIRALAKQTGFTPRTIANWTSEPREVYLARAAHRREQIRALHEAEPDLSMRAIAARLGIHHTTVSRTLREQRATSGD